MKRKIKNVFLALAAVSALAGCTQNIDYIDVKNQNPSLSVAAENTKAWASGVTYKIGDVVTYNGAVYTCRMAHTSIVSWEPANVPALWLLGGEASTEPVPVPPSEGKNDESKDTETPSVAGIPGIPSIEQTKWNGDSSFGIRMNMWWGNNGTLCELYEDGVLIDSVTLTDATPSAQSYTFNLSGKANGTYKYTVKLINSLGSSSSNTVNYTVTNSSSDKTPVDPDPVNPDPVNPEPEPIPVDPEPIPYPINTELPKRIMSGYWHTWENPGNPLIPLRDVDSNWDVINVSFCEPAVQGGTDGRMKLAIGGNAKNYTLSDMKKDIALLQSKGKKVVLSIGGYEGYFYLESKSAVNQFVKDVCSFIDEYNFNGIDIDLERDSVQFTSGADPDFKNPKSPRIVNTISAIRQICDKYDENFILSWAPETFYMQQGYTYYGGLNGYVDARCGDYLPMIYALRDKTTYVQTQLYNSGAIKGIDGNYYSMGDEKSVVAMCEMLLKGFYINGDSRYFWPGLRADQIVIAVPSSSGAAGSGQVSNSALQSAFRKLEKNYPGIRGIMAWSINWDSLQNGNSFVKENGAFLKSLD